MSSPKTLVIINRDGNKKITADTNEPLEQAVFSRDTLAKFNINTSNVDTMLLDVHNGTMAGPALWDILTNTLREQYNKYSGFVIATDTNALAETVSALSFSVQNPDKPIILTGLMPPDVALGQGSVSAQKDIADSMDMAKENIKGVFLLNDGELIPGHRAIHMKASGTKFGAFRSGITLSEPFLPEKAGKPFWEKNISEIWDQLKNAVTGNSKSHKIDFRPGFSTDIFVFSLISFTPFSTNPDFMASLLKDSPKTKGIIIVTPSTYEKLPAALENLLAVANEVKVPVVLINDIGQPPLTSALQQNAEKENPALTAVHGISQQCVIPKFEWLLGQATSFQAMRTEMQHSHVGEVIEPPKDPATRNGIRKNGFHFLAENRYSIR